ncbi:MAG: MaoC family dehydratase [Xanthobacteraceae bacterium]|nr:MaoC family dehydratase [Xanthobacteraceae bacterium]
MDAKTARICYEDFEVGSVKSFGPRLVTREEIIEFATEFDPQPMHLDEEAANRSMLKGLSGSGWHTCAIMMRIIYDGFLHESSSLGAPGVDEVRWIRPVRPNDELTIRITILEKRDSGSRPQVGIVRFNLEMTNAKGETVMASSYSGFFGKRNAGAA